MTTPLDLRSPRPERPLQAVPDLHPVAASATQFSETVRSVVTLARRGGLDAPVFRSPPTLDGVDRTIRRRTNGTVVVAVRRAGRPLPAVQSDVIEGVVAANELNEERADRFRRAAWRALEGEPADRDDGGARRRAGSRPATRVA